MNTTVNGEQVTKLSLYSDNFDLVIIKNEVVLNNTKYNDIDDIEITLGVGDYIIIRFISNVEITVRIIPINKLKLFIYTINK